MFSESTDLYDKIYARVKNYPDEAQKVRAWISRLRPNAKSVLDVACGTGEHARHLSSTYQVDGLDLSPGFVRIAQAKNPQGRFSVADMTQFELGKRYDVVTCLFSSIGYAQSVDKLTQAIACFATHLNKGGVVMVEPWFTPEAWMPGNVHMHIVDEPNFKVCRMSVSETREGRLSAFKFHYLVGTPQGVRHFTEDHALGLFTMDEMKIAFVKNGFRVDYDAAGIFGRGLYIAERAAS